MLSAAGFKLAFTEGKEFKPPASTLWKFGTTELLLPVGLVLPGPDDEDNLLVLVEVLLVAPVCALLAFPDEEGAG